MNKTKTKLKNKADDIMKTIKRKKEWWNNNKDMINEKRRQAKNKQTLEALIRDVNKTFNINVKLF